MVVKFLGFLLFVREFSCGPLGVHVSTFDWVWSALSFFVVFLTVNRANNMVLSSTSLKLKYSCIVVCVFPSSSLSSLRLHFEVISTYTLQHQQQPEQKNSKQTLNVLFTLSLRAATSAVLMTWSFSTWLALSLPAKSIRLILLLVVICVSESSNISVYIKSNSNKPTRLLYSRVSWNYNLNVLILPHVTGCLI